MPSDGRRNSRNSEDALIDSGVHVSLASTRLAHALKLPRRKHLIHLSGVASAHTIDSHYTATIKLISPDDPTKTLSLTVVLLKNVLPDIEPIDSKAIRDDVAFKGLKLADSDYDRAGKIDLLLGAGVRPWLTLSSSIVNKERIQLPLVKLFIVGCWKGTFREGNVSAHLF